jgi:RimJ/RimL family protein N-acetyltransferase
MVCMMNNASARASFAMSSNVPKPILPIELQTDRLLLRPMREDDIEMTVASLGDLEISRRLARIPHPYTEADAHWWLEETRRGRASGTVEHFMIELRASGAPIGAIGLHQDAAGERAEVGYWLAKAHWNRGYAREALAMVVRYAFFERVPVITTLEAKAHASNPASIRVLEACGFLDVGSVECTSLATSGNIPARQFELRREVST